MTLISSLNMNWLIIRQKGESQNGGNKKTEHAKFFKKPTFLTPVLLPYYRRIGF